MKALITAAGMGARFGTMTEHNNKCLFEIEGRSLLRISVDILKDNGIDEIVVVTGHCYEKIEEQLSGMVSFAYNPFYQISGILPSLWLGSRLIGSDSFIFVTGDSLYHPGILKKCIESDADIGVCIERKQCDAEDSKVTVSEGVITDIGKNIPVVKADGEFIGMVKLSANAAGVFFERIETTLKQGKINAYVADIIMSLKDSGLKIKPVYTNPLPRIEIDSLDDLQRARQLFAGQELWCL